MKKGIKIFLWGIGGVACLGVLAALVALPGKQDVERAEMEERPVQDWTPPAFKDEHPREWKVIVAADSVRQLHETMDEEVLAFYDSEMGKYLDEKKIRLPEDPRESLPVLEEIIARNFSLEEYDGSNMDMFVASSNERAWKRYIGWKYMKAVAAECPQINWKKEGELLDSLAARLSDCFYGAGGSGSWMSYAIVDNEKLDCMHNILYCCLNCVTDGCTTSIPDKEFDAMFAEIEHMVFYVEKGGETYEEVRPDLIHNLASAFRDWRSYRLRTYNMLMKSDPALASAYRSAVRPYERIFFIHLKNHLEDFGIMSASYMAILLQEDCTDEMMYGYSFEKAEAEYLDN